MDPILIGCVFIGTLIESENKKGGLNMIETAGIKADGTVVKDVSVDELKTGDFKWYWIHFARPTKQEDEVLVQKFDFHPLAIEDCFNYTQRPKMDYYEGHQFIAMQELERKTMEQMEVDVFLGSNFIVTYAKHDSRAIKNARHKLGEKEDRWSRGPDYLFYAIADEIVDEFFPFANDIEDMLEEINEKATINSHKVIDEVFELRTQLIRLRKTVRPMRELMYRMFNSSHVYIGEKAKHRIQNVHDHLTKVAEMIEDNREMANDIRENYLSGNAHKMNQIMKTLTAISIIFMPLTFIVGIYGMNFDILPELHWKYGYLLTWLVMLGVTGGLMTLFKKKDWF
jgi:magnesium transporter